ncbi:MAG: MBL fold metallo-hydrolase [Devosia sp.]
MKVHMIETGQVRIKTAQIEARRPAPLSLIDILTDPNWSGWFPTYLFAIETRDGVIVVDSGQAMHLLEETRRSWHPFIRWEALFRMTPEQEIGPQLRALGIGRRDVSSVILTHMHIDHDGGLAHFAGNKVFAASGEIARAKGVAGMIRGYLPQRWPPGFDPLALMLTDGPHGPFSASKRLDREGRVIAVATPGHTADHISVIVECDDAAVFLAGDTSYTEALMLAGKVDGVSPDQAVTRRTLGAIRQFASMRPTIYLPAHDPEGGRRFARRQTVGAHAALEAA